VRPPDVEVPTDVDAALRTLKHTQTALYASAWRLTRHGTEGGWLDEELAEAITDLEVTLTFVEAARDDPSLQDELPRLLANLRRGLTRLAHVLLAVAGGLLRRPTRGVRLPWQLTPDHVPVADLTATVAVLRAHAVLTAAPPTPVVLAGVQA
jgi:hypothetical protein